MSRPSAVAAWAQGAGVVHVGKLLRRHVLVGMIASLVTYWIILLLQALYPPFAVGARQPTAASHSPPAVSEVHLRRLDRDNILHRRAVAEVLIDASPQEVSPES